MKILVYYQYPNRTIFIESLVQSFIEKGHEVFFLTICERGVLHEKMEALGATVASYKPAKNKLSGLFADGRFFIKYCRRNKIEVVYSHLQYVNLVALLSQNFIRAKILPCRHHADEVALVANKNALRIDRLVNRFAKKIIVVSNAVKRQMTEKEGVKAEKIVVIPLGYNFALYDKPVSTEVLKIRQQWPCQLLLIVIARMTKDKRHIITLQALHQLVNDGYDVKMLILGSGTEEKNLKNFVAENKLQDKVGFTGFLNNTMDYLAASDLLLNPSVIEASNQVVKEAALLGKPFIACSGIGDFDEYVRHRENSFLVAKDNTMNEMVEIIKEYYNKGDELKQMGEKIKEEVLNRFDIKKVSEQYLLLAK